MIRLGRLSGGPATGSKTILSGYGIGCCLQSEIIGLMGKEKSTMTACGGGGVDQEIGFVVEVCPLRHADEGCLVR